MNSKELIPPAYVAWRAGMSYRPARPGLIKRLRIRALHYFVRKLFAFKLLKVGM
jgi:hypothetical protein